MVKLSKRIISIVIPCKPSAYLNKRKGHLLFKGPQLKYKSTLAGSRFQEEGAHKGRRQNSLAAAPIFSSQLQSSYIGKLYTAIEC